VPQDPSTYSDPDGHAVGVFDYPPPTYRPRWWLHWLLFALTLLFTTFIGAGFIGWLPPDLLETEDLTRILLDLRFWLEGLKFSLPLLFILLCHEIGHYAACRAHGLVATPPFFIPFPLGIGTLGAVIRIKEPIRRKRQLLDIGAAGPIAGFVALLPCLVAGLAWSEASDVVPEHNYYSIGEPLAYRLVQALVNPELADAMSLRFHPTAFAAWVGLLITLLNMLPLAQLDGGHVAYALFGRFHRVAVWPMLGLLFGLGFIWYGWWVWAVIVVILRVQHPPIWDEHIPLDRRRQIIGWIAFAVFALSFMLKPIEYVP
jgi:membrane-associated protease RseP (regulator of RpoE activity)